MALPPFKGVRYSFVNRKRFSADELDNGKGGDKFLNNAALLVCPCKINCLMVSDKQVHKVRNSKGDKKCQDKKNQRSVYKYTTIKRRSAQTVAALFFMIIIN